VIKDGGYKIKGKDDIQIVKLLEDAKAVEKAGAFAVVIEGTICDRCHRHYRGHRHTHHRHRRIA
jgi:ketopantoate hydroxymethyltransferase